MTFTQKIEGIVKNFAEGTGIFLVEVKVNHKNEITVVADTREGITIDECAALNLFLEKNLSREEEDFGLQVSSPGIGHPFQVKEQYYKSEGRTIAVTLKDGRKLRGILRNVTDKGFNLEPDTGGGGKTKSKAREINCQTLDFEDVKTAKEILIFR